MLGKYQLHLLGALLAATLVSCGGGDDAAQLASSQSSASQSSVSSSSSSSASSGSVSSSSSSSSAASSQGTTAGTSCGLGTAVYALSSGTATTTGVTYSTSTADQSAVCARNYGTALTLNNPTIIKSGATSNEDNSSFYGLNAAVLAYGSSTTTNSGGSIAITGGTISTSGYGGNAVFASGKGASVTLDSVTITATGNPSCRGIDAAMGGSITATNITASTTGERSSVIATDRGGGTVVVNGGTFAASGFRAAAIYSTGDITVNNATLSSARSGVAIIEGKNSITLNNAILNATNPDETRGIYIYQSYSGDAESGHSTFTMTNGQFNWKTSSGDAFRIGNQTTTINLTNVTFSMPSTSQNLLKAAVITLSDGLSQGTSAGGIVTLNASNQTLYGNIVVDSSSEVTLNLSNGSSLSSTINTDTSAKVMALSLDSTSTWTATGASYLTQLSGVVINSANLVTNITGATGVVVYYKSATNSSGVALSGTYSLSGGGELRAY